MEIYDYQTSGGKNVILDYICKKQKGKAEKQEIDKALKRAKREGLM